MIVEKQYIINQHFMYMIGQFDRFGKLCTIVTEMFETKIVDRSPLEILDDSIKSIGFNLRGALESAKWHIGEIPMCPVMINPIHKICVFPTKSAKHIDTIWFNPYHIIRTSSLFRLTNLELRNGLILKIPTRLTSFNSKLQTAEQLRKITIENGTNPVIDPKIGRSLFTSSYISSGKRKKRNNKGKQESTTRK